MRAPVVLQPARRERAQVVDVGAAIPARAGDRRGPAGGRDPRAQVVEDRLADGDPVVAHAVARSTSRGRGTSTPRSLRTARRTAWMPRRRDVAAARGRAAAGPRRRCRSTRLRVDGARAREHGGRDVLRVRRDRLGDDRVVALAQRAVAAGRARGRRRARSARCRRAGRRGPAGGARARRAPCRRRRSRRACDGRGRPPRRCAGGCRRTRSRCVHVRDPLDVGEVAHDELGEVHPVDERERDGPAAEAARAGARGRSTRRSSRGTA